MSDICDISIDDRGLIAKKMRSHFKDDMPQERHKSDTLHFVRPKSIILLLIAFPQLPENIHFCNCI